MEIVILTAFFVGGATALGAAVGLLFRHTTKAFNDRAMALAAGVMLAAAVLGLVLPSVELGGRFAVAVTTVGIFLGAASVNLLDFLLDRILEKGKGQGFGMGDSGRRVFLFVSAIALHNLPEGMAAGVGFGRGDPSGGIFIATAIALQNLPEGMAVVLAMLGVGIGAGRALGLACLTGVIEIIGTVGGYLAVSISASVLPFVLAFAGGNMLYVIADELIPDSHSGENGGSATYLVLAGFCLMLMLDAVI